MQFSNIIPDKAVSLFVKNIWLFEDYNIKNKTSLPFFADGYPGLMFQQTDNGLTVNPHNKVMPPLFLYGQTIKPIQLEITGSYHIIIFQFYPFVLRAFWGIAPESINDNCYYPDNTPKKSIDAVVKDLNSASAIQDKISIISDLLLSYFEKKKNNLDLTVRNAIQNIIDNKGQVSIQSIAENEKLNLRTFERRFLKETGLSAKKFAQIIQFQSSLQQLTVKDYTKLTDIVYENGFADQSHFIRVFKAYTGKTPKSFSK